MHKVILVTGAAQRLGAQIAQTLHAAGYRVVIHHHHSQSAAQALVAQLNQQRANSALALRADLGDASAIAPLIAAAAAHWGRLDGLVNNAAVFRATPVAQASAADWADIFDINLRAPFLLSQAALPWLDQAGGTIVNLTDIYAERAKAGFPLYSAAKAGLAGLTRALAQELAPTIRVNAVAPGAILWPEEGDLTEQNRLLTRTPLGRRGEPQDIAEAVLYLIGAAFVTGQTIAVDGGRSVSG